MKARYIALFAVASNMSLFAADFGDYDVNGLDQTKQQCFQDATHNQNEVFYSERMKKLIRKAHNQKYAKMDIQRPFKSDTRKLRNKRKK